MEWLEGERDECLEGSLGSAGSSLGGGFFSLFLPKLFRFPAFLNVKSQVSLKRSRTLGSIRSLII